MGEIWTYLASADLVERDESECLGQHRRREVGLGRDEGDEHAGEQQLRQEGDGLDAQPVAAGAGRRSGREVQLDVVGAEVVAVVDAGDVVEVGVGDEGGTVEPVHGDVEAAEGAEADEGEVQPGRGEEGTDSV